MPTSAQKTRKRKQGETRRDHWTISGLGLTLFVVCGVNSFGEALTAAAIFNIENPTITWVYR